MNEPRSLTQQETVRKLCANTKSPTKLEITIYTGNGNHAVILEGGSIRISSSKLKSLRGVMFLQPNMNNYCFSLKYESIHRSEITDGNFYIFTKNWLS